MDRKLEFEKFLLSHRRTSEQQESLRQALKEQLLQLGYMDQPNFSYFAPEGLKLLWDAYDREVFHRQLTELLGGCPVELRFSGRLHSAAGHCKWLWYDGEPGPRQVEIVLSTPLLFAAFSQGQTSHRVNGVQCSERWDVLRCVFEHELVHVCELLVWRDSSCHRPRFLDIAGRFFGHGDVHHELVPTRAARLQRNGLTLGATVKFTYRGRSYTGVLNSLRVRATVLVEDPRGSLYNDGKRYVKYYVPLDQLQLHEDTMLREDTMPWDRQASARVE
jgi:hypothetical protein